MHGKNITFEGGTFEYEVREGKTDDSSQRYFHVAVSCKDISTQTNFESLLRSIRGLLYKIGNKDPQTLWDEVGLHYASLAYPVIHEIENLMRKLITRFMLTKIGLGWIKEVIPKEVAESIKSKVPVSANYLHHVDFIQLSNFLFKPYTVGDIKVLLEKIAKSSDVGDFSIEELQCLIPKSNWERYFSPLVSCESEFLRTRWERLYELRNHVAHNRALGKSEFAEISSLVADIKPKIEDALLNLTAIKLSENEKESVAESVAIGRHALNGEYIEYWKLIHARLFELAMLVGDPINREKAIRLWNNIPSLINILTEGGILTKSWKVGLRGGFRLRNVIVHHSDVIFPESKLRSEIEALKKMLLILDTRIEKGKDGGALPDFDNERREDDDASFDAI